jgi:hypothetical protein
VAYFTKPTVVVAFPSDERNTAWLATPETERESSTPPGFYARVKPRLTFGDVRERNRRLLHVHSKGVADVDAAITDWDIAEFHTATLERVVKSWNLTSEKDGQDVSVEVNPKTIGELDDDDARAILDVVLKREVPNRNDPLPPAGDSEGTTSTSTVVVDE